MIGARTVGAAARTTELAAEHANSRVQFGQPISHFQLVQAMLAYNVIDVVTTRNLLYQVAWEADVPLPNRRPHHQRHRDWEAEHYNSPTPLPDRPKTPVGRRMRTRATDDRPRAVITCGLATLIHNPLEDNRRFGKEFVL